MVELMTNAICVRISKCIPLENLICDSPVDVAELGIRQRSRRSTDQFTYGFVTMRKSIEALLCTGGLARWDFLILRSSYQNFVALFIIFAIVLIKHGPNTTSIGEDTLPPAAG